MSRFISDKDVTPEIEAAHDALAKLLKGKHGTDTVQRVAAEIMAPALLHSRLERGYKAIADDNGPLDIVGIPRNEYEVATQPPVCDHPQLWAREGEPTEYTMEFYDLSHEGIKELLAFCDEYELQMGFSGDSPHFPGRTFCVTLTKKNRIPSFP